MSTVPTPAAGTACLDAFARELTPQQYLTWIQPLDCRHEGKSLRLTAPNRFVLQWVKERFGARIVAVATAALGNPVDVEYEVGEVDRQAAARAPVNAHQPATAPQMAAQVPVPAPVDSLPVPARRDV